MKTPDFMSYTKYNRKKNNEPKNMLLIFVAVFFAMVLFFTVIAKALSPDVDVVIGDDSETDAKETGLGVKKFIDDRLKLIQMEDNSSGNLIKDQKEQVIKTDINTFESQDSVMPEYEEEKMDLPTSSKTKTEDPFNTTSTVAPPRPQPKNLTPATQQSAPPRVSKVFVGRYATLDQAKVAQEIILDSGVNVTPFIKNLGDSYTLQIGSFSSRAKAEGIASELQSNGFPARIIQE